MAQRIQQAGFYVIEPWVICFKSILKIHLIGNIFRPHTLTAATFNWMSAKSQLTGFETAASPKIKRAVYNPLNPPNSLACVFRF
jgi:hypothetical protein